MLARSFGRASRGVENRGRLDRGELIHRARLALRGLSRRPSVALAGASGAGFGAPPGPSKTAGGETVRRYAAALLGVPVRAGGPEGAAAYRCLPRGFCLRGIFNSSAVKTSSTAASLATTFKLWPL